MANMEEVHIPYSDYQSPTVVSSINDTWEENWDIIEEEKDIVPQDLSLYLSPVQTFLGIWKLATDPDGILWIIAKVGPEEQEGWVVTFGPYEENLMTWKIYDVNFRLKVSDNSNTQNKILIDAFNWKTKHREYLEISPSDFQESGKFQDFRLQFLKWENGYEFRTFYYPNSDFELSIDYVSVETQ